MAPVPEAMREFRKQWRGLKSIGQVITNTFRDGKEVSDVRFYISSLCVGVKQFAESARGHWGIENSLHWVLDVTLHEDASRIRKGHGAENVAMLRRFAVTLFKRDSSKDSIRRKRKRAAWSTDFLESVVFQGN